MKPLSSIALLALMFIQLVASQQQPKPKGHEDSGKQLPSPIAQVSAPSQPSSEPQKASTNSESGKTLCQQIIEPVIANWPLVAIAIPAILVGWQTLKAMRESSERQLRAYVVMEVGSIVNIVDPIPVPGLQPTPARRIFQNGPRAHVQIKNTGQTPAFNVEHWGNICVREYPLASALPPRDQGMIISKSIIGPGIVNTKAVGIAPVLSNEDVAKLRASTAAIYVYGEILYEDAFGRKHFTRYRLTHNESTGVVGVSTDLTFAASGNEAD